MKKLSWQGSRLIVDANERQMPYAISHAWKMKDAVLILFDPNTALTSIHPDQLIPGRSGTMLSPAFKNVALANLDGNIVWWSEIHPRMGDERYVSLTSLDPIQLQTISNYEAQLSFATGEIEKERDVQGKHAEPWFPLEWTRIARRQKNWESCWFLGNRAFRAHNATLEIDWARVARRGKNWISRFLSTERPETDGQIEQAFESDDITLLLYADMDVMNSGPWSNIQAFGADNDLLWTAEAFKSGYEGAIYWSITCLDPVVAYTGSHCCLIDVESGRVLDSVFTK